METICCLHLKVGHQSEGNAMHFTRNPCEMSKKSAMAWSARCFSAVSCSSLWLLFFWSLMACLCGWACSRLQSQPQNSTYLADSHLPESSNISPALPDTCTSTVAMQRRLLGRRVSCLGHWLEPWILPLILPSEVVEVGESELNSWGSCGSCKLHTFLVEFFPSCTVDYFKTVLALQPNPMGSVPIETNWKRKVSFWLFPWTICQRSKHPPANICRGTSPCSRRSSPRSWRFVFGYSEKIGKETWILNK